MKFSIIIPVYNVEKYLRECIDSILKQTFEDFELILVNDGSTDNSLSICEEYAQNDNRIKVIDKENGGLSDARNVGTSVAKGEYIIYIDSDDYISDGEFLEKLSLKAEKNPDIICYKFIKFYENNKSFTKSLFSIPNFDKYDNIAQRVMYLISKDAFYCSAWTKAIKHSLIKDNNITFEKGLLGEDQEWYYHVLVNAKTIEGIDEEFIVYRQREGSITKTFKLKNLKDQIYILNKWYDGIKYADLDEDYKTALLNSLAKLYCNMLIMYVGLKDKNKNQYYGNIKELSELLKYNLNPRAKIFSKIYNVFGLKILLFGLNILSKLR